MDVKKIGVFAGLPIREIRGADILAIQTARGLAEIFPGASVDLIFPISSPNQEKLIKMTYSPIIRKYFGITPETFRIVTPLIPKTQDNALKHLISDESRGYDIFLNTAFQSDHPARGRLNIYYCMFPFRMPRSQTGNSWAGDNRHGFLSDYRLVLAISAYTKRWIREYWNAGSCVVYPPPHVPEGMDHHRKQNWITSIGRFSVTINPKRQDVLIEAFIDLVESGLADGWKLLLIGYQSYSASSREYMAMLEEKACGYPIEFHPSVDRDTLNSLLAQSRIYWHAAGYGADLSREPWKAEHFGISLVEAMAFGAVPIAFNGGGPAEIIEDGRSGYLWNTPGELRYFSREMMEDERSWRQMAEQAKQRAKKFSYEEFVHSLADCIGNGKG